MGANAPAMQMDEMRDVRENKQSSVGDLKPKKLVTGAPNNNYWFGRKPTLALNNIGV